MSEYIFSCETESPKNICQSLISIAWKKSEPQSCSISVSNTGILFRTEDQGVLQASVYLRETLFSRFYYCDDVGINFHFRVNLTSLVDCLRVFADSASHLQIHITKDEETHLRLSIEDGNSITECTLRTLHTTNDQNRSNKITDALSLSESADAAQFKIGSAIVKEMFRFPNDLKNKAVGIQMTIDPIKETFEVRAEGAFGAETSIMNFSNLMQKLQINIDEKLVSVYPVSSLVPLLSAMDFSNESSFVFRTNGVLSVQEGIKSEGGMDIIVEFIVQPSQENPF